MRIKMQDGTVVDTTKAQAHWEEDREFDGRNMVSVATGDQWTHEKLYRSRKGRYYIVHTSQWQGSRDWAEWIGPERAAAWLVANDHLIPQELEDAAEKVTE